MHASLIVTLPIYATWWQLAVLLDTCFPYMYRQRQGEAVPHERQLDSVHHPQVHT